MRQARNQPGTLLPRWGGRRELQVRG